MKCAIKIIRTDGREEFHEFPKQGLLNHVHRLIGAECCGCVSLKDGKVMIVDDDYTGAIDGLPINPKGKDNTQ